MSWYEVEFLTPDGRHQVSLTVTADSIARLHEDIQRAWPGVASFITSLGKRAESFQMKGRMTSVCYSKGASVLR